VPTIVQQECVMGIVERITFHSIETGWSVLKVAPFSQPQSRVTVLIHQAKVFAGASMAFYGTWTQHPKFGEQFRAEKALEKKPATAAALEKYLGSGLIKGVGPKTAHAIVKHFAERTLEVFEDNLDELLSVPNIAEKKLTKIRISWEEHRAIRDVMIFLQSHGISTLFAVKIFKQYGQDSIAKVSDNPYRLARDIYGIGFFSADRIALSMGFATDGVPRVQAGIKHVLASSRDEGHCYLTQTQVITNTQTLLSLENPQLINELLNGLLTLNEIKQRCLIIDHAVVDCYYANSIYRDEAYVAEKIQQLMITQQPIDHERVSTWITRYCTKQSMSLSEEQHVSVVNIVAAPFSILTGGPGCGKTTTTRVLVKLLLAMGRQVLLAAPTGRAAQRMSEVIGQEAKTIHRLLEWDPRNNGFKKGEEEPLKTDFLIVDECSMLDVNLAASLLRAVSINTQVLLIGDPDQLPSVGAGAVLQDLLSSQVVPHFKLTQIFRQAAQSLIIKYAHSINQGQIPKIASPIAEPNLWQQSVDCVFVDADEASQAQLKFLERAKRAIATTLDEDGRYYLKTNNTIVGQMHKVEESVVVEQLYAPPADDQPLNAPLFIIPEKFQHVDLASLSKTSTDWQALKSILEKVHPWSSLHYGLTALETLCRLYTKTLPEKLGKDCEIQVLTPQVRGTLGTMNLNKTLQALVNPEQAGKLQIQMGERFFRAADRVIQTRNNYDLKVFNGDIGRISAIDPEDYSCLVDFGEPVRQVVYKKEDLSELSLAYAITIHKSQGSEFEAVIIPVATQHFKMLYRNLIYTGLTRAKRMAAFVGQRKALAMAVNSVDNRHRQTSLQQLVSGEGIYLGSKPSDI